MIRRRRLALAIACWPGARLLAQQEDAPRPTHKVSAAELHKALAARFPLRLGLAGLLELNVSAPALLLLPSRNKLGASLLAEASGPALRRPQAGEMDVVFALRYEAADQSLRAHQLELLDLRMPGLSSEGLQVLQGALPAVARDAVGEIVMHRFTPRELALADTMGFEPEKVTVLEDGVLVRFQPKARR